MFNQSIVKKILESALTCKKESMFKYVNLNEQHLNHYAHMFLEEDSNRVLNVFSEDVYNFLSEKLQQSGYTKSDESVFINSNLFMNRDLFLDSFNEWSRLNPNTSTYLIPTCHKTNLSILESLISLFDLNMDKTVLERISLDFQLILQDENYNNYAKEYEFYVISLLSGCTNGSIFSNILNMSKDESFKNQIYDIISNSSNRGAISLDVVSTLGADNVPSNVLKSYIEFVNPSIVGTEMFISILNTMPLTNFTTENSDPANPVFTKYVAIINNYIQTKRVTTELITRMIQAASPETPNGWTMLKLLNQACLVFSPQSSNNQAEIATTINTVEPIRIPATNSVPIVNIADRTCSTNAPTNSTEHNQYNTIDMIPEVNNHVSEDINQVDPNFNNTNTEEISINAFDNSDFSKELINMNQPKFGECYNDASNANINTKQQLSHIESNKKNFFTF